MNFLIQLYLNVITMTTYDPNCEDDAFTADLLININIDKMIDLSLFCLFL